MLILMHIVKLFSVMSACYYVSVFPVYFGSSSSWFCLVSFIFGPVSLSPHYPCVYLSPTHFPSVPECFRPSGVSFSMVLFVVGLLFMTVSGLLDLDFRLFLVWFVWFLDLNYRTCFLDFGTLCFLFAWIHPAVEAI